MWILDAVREHLQKQPSLARDATGAASDLELQAATAILLLEAAFGDADYAWHEERVIVSGLERGFGLGKSKVLELLGRANEIRPPIVKLADVTSLLRQRFDPQQREQIARLVWEVIRADGTVAEWEGVFGDHVAKVLGLGPAEALAART
jgi:uncharacterized tellurite resistance protein B-like protein